MANFKIIQDQPDQARIKIYGSTNTAIQTDTFGGVVITSTGLSISAPTGGLLITSSGDGLLITSSGLQVISRLATTDVSFNVTGISTTTGLATTSYNVLDLNDFTFAILNASVTAANAATVALQISPDDVNWITDVTAVTLNQGDITTLVPGVFLKYARVYYAAVNAASAVDLSFWFQGQG
ncbi:hypothetical protein SCACP_34280 [Sporomusa carbonis]|uniref:DUF6385 domain-containing protein n=1 Tax=Sporomusa carbonis TaxID=3076075 RepID=UPI003A752C90